MLKLDKLPISMAGFIVGGLIASAFALLYAPKSGEQTRRDIQDKAILAKSKANMAIEDARGRVSNAVEDVQSRVQQMIDCVGKEKDSSEVNEQRTSLERGVDGAMDVMKS